MALSREHPFPGLRPFDFADREFFFGREEQTYALYRLLNRSRFVAVVGSSGSGKSSLVRAGLLPLLQEETDDEGGGACWSFAAFRPGDAPIAALRDAIVSLAPAGDLETDILAKDVESALLASSFGLSKAIEEIPALRNRNVLLVVDQFEELFRYSGRRDEATNFVQLLLEATRSHSSRIHVLVTMRSDFIGYCSNFQRLPEAVSAAQFLVPSLNRDQRTQVIRRPIEIAGGAIESLLVERLLNDSNTEVDQLPVLQHCLSRLWERAKPVDGTRRLTSAEYEALGGIGEALSRHADEVMAKLGSEFEPAVESVFRALSDTDPDGRATRRVIPFAQLLAETGLSETELRTVLDRFRDDDCSFILPSISAKPRLSDDTRIDIVHEALLRKWTRINAPPDLTAGQRESGWLAAEAEDGWEYRALLNLVKSGAKSGKVTLPLDQVEARYEWWTSRKRTPAWAERYGGDFNLVDKLMSDSLAALEAHRAEEGRAVERRREDERRKIAEEFARARARRTRNAAIAMAALAAVALICFGWALRSNERLHAKDLALANAYAKLTQANAKLAGANAALQSQAKTLAQNNASLKRSGIALTQKQQALLRAQALQGRLIAALRGLQATLKTKNAQLAGSLAQVNLLNGLREAERVTYHGAELAMLEDYVRHHPRDAGAHVDLGDMYEGMSQVGNAAKQYKSAIAADQHYAYAYASLCEADDQQNDYKGALHNCTLALQMDPRMTYALRQRGLARADLNDYHGAIADLARAVAIAPKESINLADLCYAEYGAKEYGPAIRDCNSALRADHTMTQANYWRARAEYATKQWGAAIADFSQRIASTTASYSAYYWRGRARYARTDTEPDGSQQRDDFNGAIDDMTYLIDTDPKDYGGDKSPYDAHYWRGVVEVGISRYDDAAADLSQALAGDPTDASARYWRGKAEIGLRHWQAAIADLTRSESIGIGPYWLAIAAYHARDYSVAFAAIRKYIAGYPNDGDGYYELARIELNAGDLGQARDSASKAEAIYRSASDQNGAKAIVDEIGRLQAQDLMPRFIADAKATATNPNDAVALTDRGNVYEIVGDRVSAIADYDAAIEADPKRADAFASRCASRLEQASASADFRDALADCNRAIELDPSLAYAFRQRANIAIDLLDVDDLTSANSDANRAVALDPHASSLLVRCRLFIVTQRYADAVGDCNGAIREDPQRTVAYYWRAKARWGTGDYASGIADLRRYLQVNSDDPDAYLLLAQLQLGAGDRDQARAAATTALRYYNATNDRKGAASAQKFIDALVAVGPR